MPTSYLLLDWMGAYGTKVAYAMSNHNPLSFKTAGAEDRTWSINKQPIDINDGPGMTGFNIRGPLPEGEGQLWRS
ncbi:hypothetical protein GQ53DRAFT_750427 [Thozetella sp. PMI_491]|nr:hypothetical protein GQ53DRAFT_750427 [Thozetella sp. PMI_491]